MVCVPVTRWARRRSEVLEVPSTHGTRPSAPGMFPAPAMPERNLAHSSAC